MFENLFGKKIQEQLSRPMNVALYMRTNSEECAQEKIDEQYAALKRFIEACNPPWQVVVSYRDINQRNIKAALANIGRMLDERGIEEIDAILVTSFDRISRSSIKACAINGRTVDVIAIEWAQMN